MSIDNLPPWPSCQPKFSICRACDKGTLQHDDLVAMNDLIAALRARLQVAVDMLGRVDLPLRDDDAEKLIAALKEPT